MRSVSFGAPLGPPTGLRALARPAPDPLQDYVLTGVWSGADKASVRIVPWSTA